MIEKIVNNKIKAGIIGGAGYTGGEMLRILVNHPNVEIAFVNSTSNAGNLISDVHTDLFGETDLKFVSDVPQDIDVLFLCVGHGDAKKFLAANSVNENIKIIDLSQDFRLTANGKFESRDFIYGLPELNRDKIKSAQNIANPGCFATCIQLGLLPLAAKGLIKSEVHINATTGSTGAGQSLAATSHFSWRNNNLSIYKAFEHQHLNEIGESLLQLQPSLSDSLSFIPQRGAFTRGILAAMYLESELTLEEAQNLYQDYYSTHPFTHVSGKNIDLKQVVNTNKALVHLEKHGNKLFIISIIDNLLKGASGQAVQNMNLIFGLEETAGLKLKAANF
ncbi:N-acetyl-gamma-glutamyl-phosphate reductase [Pedobacter sp. Leaf194]|uniref:N-acetyl-gamma-glutamyl-phosphate reductase n=1 Tax=Pedobacter sp. Leaf194 TaxID=1736297 RepID=UPI00070243CE|nr:N-acetyl-gamma-glutamyl-phosphate reductase [Pedobacter sp. Leaf194]KQS41452.1 N-acetyl-gamma-glutamyl-phosphate reductase [Pedobacter sp. Leaf194]